MFIEFRNFENVLLCNSRPCKTVVPQICVLCVRACVCEYVCVVGACVYRADEIYHDY